MAAAFAAHANINVDGTLDSGYGSAISLQTIYSGFNGGTNATDSELDGAYATIQGGTLYLMFTGNLQANNNHLDVFIGTGAAGQNALSGTSDGLDNLTLPTGLSASQIFDINGDGTNLYVNQVSYSGGTWTNNYLGHSAWGSGNGTLTGGGNPNNVLVAINDSNPGQAGTAGSALTPGYAAGVTTGMEFGISLAALGNPTGTINIFAALNGGGNGYLSNQFLGGANVGTQNLGSLGSNNPINLNGTGATYFNVNQSVPEPASILAFATGAIGLFIRRRQA